MLNLSPLANIEGAESGSPRSADVDAGKVQGHYAPPKGSRLWLVCLAYEGSECREANLERTRNLGQRDARD